MESWFPGGSGGVGGSAGLTLRDAKDRPFWPLESGGYGTVVQLSFHSGDRHFFP